MENPLVAARAGIRAEFKQPVKGGCETGQSPASILFFAGTIWRPVRGKTGRFGLNFGKSLNFQPIALHAT
jgi:hypothetical protein